MNKYCFLSFLDSCTSAKKSEIETGKDTGKDTEEQKEK